MTTVFSILIAICSILLILVVLIQKSKGGGLSSSFSSTNSILGVKKTTDGVEKATWVLATAIMVLCIATVTLAPKQVTKKTAVDVPVSNQSLPDMTSGQSNPLLPTDAAPADNSNQQ